MKKEFGNIKCLLSCGVGDSERLLDMSCWLQPPSPFLHEHKHRKHKCILKWLMKEYRLELRFPLGQLPMENTMTDQKGVRGGMFRQRTHSVCWERVGTSHRLSCLPWGRGDWVGLLLIEVTGSGPGGRHWAATAVLLTLFSPLDKHTRFTSDDQYYLLFSYSAPLCGFARPPCRGTRGRRECRGRGARDTTRGVQVVLFRRMSDAKCHYVWITCQGNQ